MSIAVVLGAGGVVGGAFHAGALAGLADATGFDARTADLLVGTSAGSGIAATLRAGLSPADHAARATGAPLSAEGEALTAGIPSGHIDLPTRPGFGGLALPQAPWLLAPSLLSRGGVRPGLLLAGYAPRGSIDSAPVGDRIRRLLPDRWPERPTWICAVRLRDGRRVVFGRDDVDVPDLGVAVQASCAIPGFFEPVRIGRHEYLDGGCWSATNAELAAGLGFDLVVVISTMSAVPSALGRSVAAVGRGLHARRLASEVRKLREKGSAVLTIQPTARCLQEMGPNPMDSANIAAVARTARDEVGRLLARHDIAERADLLRSAVRQA
jgi:NTE family protein